MKPDIGQKVQRQMEPHTVHKLEGMFANKVADRYQPCINKKIQRTVCFFHFLMIRIWKWIIIILAQIFNVPIIRASV